MHVLDATVEIEAIRGLERELAEARGRIARAVREQRERAGLSLRQVAPKVRMSATNLSLIERGRVWETKTVARVLRFYERQPTQAA